MRNKSILIFLSVVTIFAVSIVYLDKPKQSGCHFKAHVTAFEEVKKNPAKWETVLTKYPVSACTGGYLMGALEGHKAFDSAFKLDEKTSVGICEKIDKKNTGKKTEMTCMHTMGHLFLTEQKGDLDKTISICKKVPTKYQGECFAGIFMENIYRRNLAAHNIADVFDWNKESLEIQKDLCNKYYGNVAKACWREISHMFVHLSKDNPQEVYELCSQARKEKETEECYIHAVGVMTLTANSDNMNFCQPYENKRNKHIRCESMLKNNQLDYNGAMYDN